MIIWIKKKLIEANEKLYNENADQNIALVENITNNKLSEIELKKKKKQEQELAEKIEASKIHLENKKNKSLLEFSKFTEDIKQKTNRIISDAKIDIENEFKKINQDNINQNKSLKFENEQLTKQIEQQKTELKELSDNKLALTEIQNNKVAVNTHILDKVAKHISDTSDAKITSDKTITSDATVTTITDYPTVTNNISNTSDTYVKTDTTITSDTYERINAYYTEGRSTPRQVVSSSFMGIQYRHGIDKWC